MSAAMKRFLKAEPVFVAAGLCALVSMLAVPPSAAYLGYIDFRVLALLFCLMAVVAGLERAGVFLVLSQRLLAGAKNLRLLCMTLVLLPFFSSMLITNDVSLFTFVPFAVMVLTFTGQTSRLIYVVTLQTVAANIGSMLTPVGNPQNLYLYSKFGIPAGEFFSLTLPVTVVSLLMLCAAAVAVPGTNIQVHFEQEAHITDQRRLWMHLGLAALCLGAVFHLVHYLVVLAIVALCMACFDRSLFAKVDYWLLATFVCFFVFAGNIGELEQVRQMAAVWLEGRTMLISVLTSQVISNVPAAVLLSSFTSDYRGLLLGTNLGGLGTLVASLASLISFKLYAKTEGAKPGKYLAVFTTVNVAFLVVLLLFALWMY